MAKGKSKDTEMAAGAASDTDDLVPEDSPPIESPDPTLKPPPAPAAELVVPASADVPPHSWFRVSQAYIVLIEGTVHRIAAGSLVSEATHDLATLRRLGVQLVPSEAPKRPLDAYGDPT